jgi:hypothetical protein
MVAHYHHAVIFIFAASTVIIVSEEINASGTAKYSYGENF